MILLKRHILFFLLVMLLPTGVKAGDYVLVVSKNNPIESLDKFAVKKIFLGKKTYWADGQGIELIVQAGGDVHRSFVHDVLHKSPRQFLMYWKKALFSGNGIPPKQQPDDLAVKEAVAANPLAIGYIDVRQLDETVKEVRIN